MSLKFLLTWLKFQLIQYSRLYMHNSKLTCKLITLVDVWNQLGMVHGEPWITYFSPYTINEYLTSNMQNKWLLAIFISICGIKSISTCSLLMLIGIELYPLVYTFGGKDIQSPLNGSPNKSCKTYTYLLSWKKIKIQKQIY